MVNISRKFMQQLYNDQRNYFVRVVINLADTNQTVLTLTNENIWDFSPTIDDAVSSDEDLQVGTAIINKFSFTINNIYETYSQYDFKDAKVFLTVGLDIGDDTVERIKKGTFYVDTADYNDTFIALECLDGMYKLEKPYKTSAVTFPATADYVVQNICTACGVINDTPNFPNKSFILSNAPDKDTCTYREVLSWVAQICGCFARFNSEGHLELKWYDRQSLEDIMDGLDGGVFDSVSQSRYTTGDTADGGAFNPWNTGYEFDAGDFDDMIKDVHLINSAYSQSMSVDDVVITGVRILVKTKDTDNTDVIASHVTGTEGYVIEISENPFITEANVATILSYLGTQLVGLTFRKANLSIPSDPSFEAGDVAIYFDKNGNYHPILVSRTTFITGDAQTIVSSAQTPARNSAERYSAETKNYVATQKQLRAEKTAREAMYDDLQEQIANASGLYYTEVEDPDTHAVTVYYHNKPDLEESEIQIVISDVGITVTDDGGESWYGLEVNGNMIASILSAYGVNADWINAGTVTGDHINAIGANIGGFTIDATSIRNGELTSTNSGAVALTTSDFTRLINNADVTNLRFAIGSSFGVKNTGALYAYSGKIGGWDIYNSDLRSNSLIISSINLQRTIQGTSTSDCRVIMGSDFCIRSNGGIVCGGVTATGLYAGTAANDNKQWGITGSGMSFESVTIGTPIVYFSVGSTGNVYTRGNLSVTGTKSIIAETEDYGEQAYYCYETPTPMLGDIGSGVLDETGMCVVALDDIFAESVSTDIQYQVFLQKCGNGDLWVELKDNAYFVVRGTPNLAFDWEVKAKQGRYNQVRYNNDEQIVSDYYPENFTNIYSCENDTEQKQQEEFENIMLNDALSGEEQNILEYLLYDCF